MHSHDYFLPLHRIITISYRVMRISKYVFLWALLTVLTIYPESVGAYNVISLGDALEISESQNLSFATNRLEQLLYQYAGQDAEGTSYWVQGCKLTKDFTVNTKDGSDIPMGASVVSYNPDNARIGLKVLVFHSPEIRKMTSHLELCNYTYKLIDKELEVYAWKQHQDDDDEHPIYMVLGKIYADNYNHGYVIIFGGEVTPPVAEVKERFKSHIGSDGKGNGWFGIFKSIASMDSVKYFLIGLAVLIVLFLLTGGKVSQVGSLFSDLALAALISALLYVALYISMHIGVYIALAKNLLPDFWNMFIVINGFSVAGFISGLIGTFWNAVWAGASVAFPVAVASTMIVSCKTGIGKAVLSLCVVAITIYAVRASYLWVTSADEPFWGSTMFDYYTLMVAHGIGGCLGLFIGVSYHSAHSK